MEIQIRKMTLSDLNSISDNLESDFDDFWNVSIFKQVLINENSYYVVALLDNEIVGFAGYMDSIDVFEITNIVVKKSMRNKKIATNLLKALLDTIHLKPISLEVNENNLPAISLYKKFGFLAKGIRKSYYNGIDGILMEKEMI